MIGVGLVFGDAWALYRLLWRRGIAVSAAVFAIVAAATWAFGDSRGGGSQLAILILDIVATVFVQGMLVESVRNAHEGRPQDPVRAVYERVGTVFPSLFGGAIVYAVCVAVGLILLIVPGVILLTRWALFVPLIVLEGKKSRDARIDSNALVKGHSIEVFFTVLIMYVVLLLPNVVLVLALGGGAGTAAVVGFFCSTLAAPFEAHCLTAIYYRLRDPQRPVLHPSVTATRQA